ncbi:MAG: PAC2 family protein [Dehalococcoidia bacterium]
MEYLEVHEVPSLRSPVLIMAFAGWNDAAQAATSAVRFLIKEWSAQPFASFDPEELFDFTSTRPHVRLDADLQRELEWPSNRFFYHADPGLERDVVLLLGTEPHLKWRTFTRAVLELAERCGVSLVMSLGALLADTAHSRPVPLSGFVTDPGLAERLGRQGITSSRYEGPTGIVGVLHDAFRRQGLPSASLWAAAPHYLGTTPNPKATAALLRTLDGLFSFHLDLRDLDEAAEHFERQVAEILGSNPEIAAYVQELEQRADASVEERPGDESAELPSGETMVRELEDFLRHRREEQDQE